ncbi:MAG: hypothetical protein ISR84_00370 [Kiritimatiellales bacterium]|nr:hypothetical protein [Kiritimatiellales bacterium]
MDGRIYDALGNIQTRSGVVGTYLYEGPRPHAVTSAGGCDYIYDDNGNIVRRKRNNVYGRGVSPEEGSARDL